MKTRTIYHLMSLLVILSLALAACATPAQPKPVEVSPTQAAQPAQTSAPAPAAAQAEAQTLRVWISWGDNPAQLQELFDRYGKANNVKVEVTAPVENDKVLAALTGSEPPDILVLSGGDLVKSYDAQGLVEPLNDWATKTNIEVNDIFPSALGQCQKGDKLVCLPWGADAYALFWNKDLFEAAGLDPEKPPKTMEELVEYADKLTVVESDGKVSQVGFIPDFSWSHNDLYTAMLGGFWYNKDGTQVTVNSQPMIDSLLWQQKFYTKYGADNVLRFTSGLGDYMSPDQGFYAGKVAMMVDGEWQVGANFIQKNKPELNYGVAAFPPPAANPDRAGIAVIQGSAVIIPTGAKNKEASAKLLAWMLSPEILAEEMFTNSNLPTSRKAAQDPRFKSLPNFQVFIDLMNNPNSLGMITTPVSLELNEKLGQIEEQVLHAAADPKPLLDEAQAEFEAKLKEALAK